MIQKMMTFKF